MEPFALLLVLHKNLRIFKIINVIHAIMLAYYVILNLFLKKNIKINENFF